MRSLLIIVVLAAAAGCKKSKPAPPDTGPPPAADRNPPAVPDSRAPQAGGSGPGVIPSPAGGGVVTNPGAAAGGGGGGGAVQAVRKAARRTQALNEMNTLGQVISLMQADLGRMPTREQIVAELRQYPQVLAAVKEGAYVLTGTNQAGGLWAYEADADRTPGIALIGGRATRTTPEDLAPYFRKN